ncbi:MAG TPA: cyclase family protein [Solirubrobacteraceae bacterium]|jgi:kynurenine formamidase
MRFVDLSAPIRPDPPELPDVLRTDLAYEDHAAGAAAIQTFFGVGPELLRDGEGWATDTFTRLGTHNSTHVDAPWHYNSQIAGRRAQTIDELPLDWFFAPGVVVDAIDRADGDALDVEDVQARLPRPLAARDIVLVHTGRDAFYGDLDYVARGPGVTAGATRWLYEQGVRVMGVDAWGWDAPLHLQAERAKAAGRPGIFWAAHQVDLGYAQIERLVNLGELPPEGFSVACFPLRIAGASAAPARVVAIV